MKLLLIEDDISLSGGLVTALQQQEFIVEACFNGQSALDNLAVLAPEIVILDLGLPDMDGKEVLAELRRRLPELPVLVLTARSDLENKVQSLDLGAEDYLCKPFAMPELLARLRVMSRRLGTARANVITIGSMVMDVSAQTVSIDGAVLPLTRREFNVLKALLENTDRIQTKESLENKLYSWGEEIASNTIEVHISNLRKKIPAGIIQTVRGVGYKVAKDVLG